MKIILYWFGILFLFRKIFVSFVHSTPLKGVGEGFVPFVVKMF